MLPLPPLESLRFFEAAHPQSFARAAEERGVTPDVVSAPAPRAT